MELRILVVDDQPVTGCYLQKIIEEVPETKVVNVVTSAREAVQQAELHKPQAVFLDIDMPEMDGMALAHVLQEKQKDIYIVFATALPDYALKAFEIYSFDYILKPFDMERIKKTVRKLKEAISRPMLPNANADNTLRLAYNGRKIFLRIVDILFIESRQPKRIYIKTMKNAYLIRGDLNSVEQKLKQDGFFRCHRAFLVNLRQVKEILPSGHTYEIILYSGDRVLLSRKHEKNLRERLINS